MASLLFDSLRMLELNSAFSHSSPQTLLVSGGQDSATLVWLHAHLTVSDRVSTTHYNHLWREDAMYAAQHILTTSFWFNIRHRDVLPMEQYSTEHRASVWRKYQNQSMTYRASTTMYLNGHTQTDQTESNIFRELRRAQSRETDSLSTAVRHTQCTNQKSNIGTRWFDTNQPRKRLATRQLQLVWDVTGDKQTCNPLKRPLQVLTRETTRLLLQTYRVPVYPDPTNLECTSTRAQIRYILWPLLLKLGLRTID